MDSGVPARARTFAVIALGRAAVDLYGEQIGGRLEDMTSFAKYLGGCPANISVGAARLGLKPAMLTRVGDEHMGRFVRETLAAEGVDVSHVRTDRRRLTALVILGIRNRHSFPHIFYRENCADMAVSAEDFDEAFIASARALLVTGTHFSTPAVDHASRTAMRHARSTGTKIALDIDYRPVLWGLAGHEQGAERFVASDNVSNHLLSIAAQCDVIVGTEEEIHIAGGATDTLAALRRIRDVTAATLVLKLGAGGCAVFTDAIPNRIEDALVVPGFPVEVFNVLGAGDGFMAGLLRGWLGGEDWARSCTYANGCGALVVARHGCAPAMPSWTELSDFLSRPDRPRHAHQDARLARLHRVTTRRPAASQVCVLAFDHRLQFEALAARAGAGRERIHEFKKLIAAALMSSADAGDERGAIIDDRYGNDSLHAMTGNGHWLARPIERPGTVPLEFEAGPDPAITLREWPAEHVVKCLVTFDPEDSAELHRAQDERLVALARACTGTDHEWVLEVMPRRPTDAAENIVISAVQRYYAIGLQPDWWKLPPLADASAWRSVGDLIRENDEYCRGILILGFDSSDDVLGRAFAAAAREPLVRGFAVGRAIFWSAADDWFAGRIGDGDAVTRIAARYQHVRRMWRDARAASA